MKKPNGWENTQAVMGGEDYEVLTPGGHIVKILNAETAMSRAGKDMLVLNFEIAEGSDFDGMMQRAWKRRQKWPVSGTYYQLTEDQQGGANPRFKGLIKAVEESNSGYAWNWDERTLKGRQVGMIFREEEYEANDGTVRTSVKPIAVCPALEAMDKAAPAKKLLERADKAAGQGFTEEKDDDLPF